MLLIGSNFYFNKSINCHWLKFFILKIECWKLNSIWLKLILSRNFALLGLEPLYKIVLIAKNKIAPGFISQISWDTLVLEVCIKTSSLSGMYCRLTVLSPSCEYFRGDTVCVQYLSGYILGGCKHFIAAINLRINVLYVILYNYYTTPWLLHVSFSLSSFILYWSC